MPLTPPKLKPGDEIQVIAPSSSLDIVPQDLIHQAVLNLQSLGLRVSFSEHSLKRDSQDSSDISCRISDLHNAFLNPNVRCILAAEGGFNSNQLLGAIDWDLVRTHPKIFCGYSDISALLNATFSKTGLVTYHGPDLSTLGLAETQDYTLQYFRKCLFDDAPYPIQPSERWEDAWDNKGWPQPGQKKTAHQTEWLVINEGCAEGVTVGGNLSTFGLLQGTDFLPDLKDSLLFIEEDHEAHPKMFDRTLQSLIHQKHFHHVRGLILGRFETSSGMTQTLLTEIIRSKAELAAIPVIANVDFGHTYPTFTFPIGGTARIKGASSGASLEIITH